MVEGEPTTAERVFLSDEALGELGQDRLGHRVYVEILRKMVTSCPTPFTIGLLGKWGTGKTSIGRILLNEVSQDIELQNRFKTMLFDVWRYPGDAIRRKFLLDAAKCLGEEEAFAEKQELWEELYGARSKTTELTFEFDPRRVWWLWVFLFLYVVGAVVLFYWALLNALAEAEYLGLVSIGVTLFLAVLAATSSVFRESQSTSATTFTTPPLHSPEQFEERFEALLKLGKVSSQPDGRRLLVVVDNLDRCSSEGAVEALRTIKTFLEKDGCIFLIPCDDAALRKHLKSTYGWDPDSEDASEYLRKFFNTALRIRPAVEDLTNLVIALSSEMGFSEDVAQVVWAAAPRDPRRVKEFLNRLRAIEMIADLEEGRKRLPTAVRNNLAFMAKVMVLDDKWRKLVDHLERDDSVLRRLGEVLMDPDLLGQDTYTDLGDYVSDDAKGKYSGLKEFLRATSPVKAEDHRPFLSLRQYTYEVAIDNTAGLREEIRLGDVASVRSAMTEAALDELAAIWRVVCQVMAEEREEAREQTGLASAMAATDTFDTCPEEMQIEVANAITTTVCQFSSCLPDVLPRKTLAMLEHADPDWAERVIDRLIASLGATEPSERDFLRAFPGHHRLLTNEQLNRVVSFLANELRSDWDGASSVLREMMADGDGVRRLFSAGSELLAAVVDHVDPDKLEQASSAAEIYATFKGSASDPVRAQMIGRIIALLAYPTSPPMGDRKQLALSILDQFELADIPSANTDALGASLLAAIAEVGHVPNKVRLWAQALRLRGQLSEGQGQTMDSALRESVLGWPPEHVRALTQLQPLQAGQEAPTVALVALASRILDRDRPWEEKAGLLECYADTLPSKGDGQLQELLGSLLDSTDLQMVKFSAEAAPKYFDRLDRDQQLRLVEKLRERTRSLDLAQKHLTLTPLTSLTRKSDGVGLRNAIGDELLSVMKDGEVSSVQIGARQYGIYRTRLSKERRATNARELIHSLERRRPQLGEPFRPLLELVAEESNEVRVGQPALTQFIYLLLSMTQAEKPVDQRLLGISSLAKLESLTAQARPEVREQLETIIDDAAPPGAIRDAATELYVRLFGGDRKAPSEPRADEDHALGAEDAESVEGHAITILSGEAGEFSESRNGAWTPAVACSPVHHDWSAIEGAQWVWIEERPSDVDAQIGQTVWHRLAVQIPANLTEFSAILRLMVDDFVKVFVNGELVGQFKGHREEEEVDLTSHLHQGSNLVEMQMENSPGHAESTGVSNPSGIIYRLDVL